MVVFLGVTVVVRVEVSPTVSDKDMLLREIEAVTTSASGTVALSFVQCVASSSR